MYAWFRWVLVVALVSHGVHLMYTYYLHIVKPPNHCWLGGLVYPTRHVGGISHPTHGVYQRWVTLAPYHGGSVVRPQSSVAVPAEVRLWWRVPRALWAPRLGA